MIFSDCPAEFLHDANRGFCHKVVRIRLSFDAAASHCEQWGSGLVSIETEEENNYLSLLPTGKLRVNIYDTDTQPCDSELSLSFPL